MTASDTIAALTAALAAERAARQQAEARAAGAEALVAYYKLQIAKLRREQYGQSSEHGRKLLDQLELQLEEAAASAAEDETAAAASSTTVQPFSRNNPVRAPFPAHLPRERVVIPAPSACPCFSIRPCKRKHDLSISHLALSDRVPAGPCFSPGSAPRPSQYGFRRMRWNNLRRVLRRR